MSYSAQESNLELYTTIWTLKDTYVVEFTILWKSLSVDYYLEEIIIIHVESSTLEGRSMFACFQYWNYTVPTSIEVGT